MMSSVKLMERVLTDCDNDPKRVVELLRIIDSIHEDVIALEREKEKAKRDYEMHLKAISMKLLAVQIKCKHWETKRHYDPAGTCDSWTECLICGAEL